MTIGFIGLGNLGTPIAENLLSAQQPLYIYNRTAAKAQPLANKGAVICTSVKDLAQRCDIVFTIVADDAALNHITDGPEGLAAHLKAGGIHVSMSTILPATSEALQQLHHAHGSEYIACPVMGRPDVARARNINFLVSGNAAAIQTIKPLLQQAGGAAVWEFGDAAGAANTAKLCSNYLVLAAVSTLAEGINLAQRSGIDTKRWMQMLTQTYFDCRVYKGYSDIILREAYQPAGFSLKLGLKDVNLIMQLAQNVKAPMPAGENLQHLLQQALAQGLAEYDVTALALPLQGRSATANNQ